MTLHFIREVVASKRVKIIKIATEENPVDFLTKLVTLAKFQLCRSLVGGTSLDQG